MRNFVLRNDHSSRMPDFPSPYGDTSRGIGKLWNSASCGIRFVMCLSAAQMGDGSIDGVAKQRLDDGWMVAALVARLWPDGGKSM